MCEKQLRSRQDTPSGCFPMSCHGLWLFWLAILNLWAIGSAIYVQQVNFWSKTSLWFTWFWYSSPVFDIAMLHHGWILATRMFAVLPKKTNKLPKRGVDFDGMHVSCGVSKRHWRNVASDMEETELCGCWPTTWGAAEVSCSLPVVITCKLLKWLRWRFLPLHQRACDCKSTDLPQVWPLKYFTCYLIIHTWHQVWRSFAAV